MDNSVNQFQYFGLASAFREVDVSGRIDFGYFHPINIVLDGEFVDNTAFNKAAVGAVAVNNIGGYNFVNPDGDFCWWQYWLDDAAYHWPRRAEAIRGLEYQRRLQIS